jgi:TolB-like protein
MPGDPNKLSQFWQELKRRKVIRTITVYAAAAFVILELLSIIIEPLKLPEWTLQFAIVFLCIGFIIAIILSWIYDIHPEGGIVKTEPIHKVQPEDKPGTSNSWKIASYISFLVIVVLIILNIIPRTGKDEILDKSIAVLPFINDSREHENEHLINGIMEDLLINLQSIRDLRVPGRTSIEQYRNNPKPIPEIAAEMNVTYILEGSGQRYGNKIRLRVQLVEGASDKHIWADSYDEVINGPEDIFRIQSQIARSIAAELQAVITPEEEKLIEKTHTTNLTAFNLYQQGRGEYWNYYLHGDLETLDRAELRYKEALVTDSTFALAYSGLAETYWERHFIDTYFADDFMDSVLILTDIALSNDDQLAEAYVLRGRYYIETGKFEQALKDINRAIKLNPNDWNGYEIRGDLYFQKDSQKAIENRQKAISLNPGPQLPRLLSKLADVYDYVGITEKSKQYYQQAFNLGGDSIDYYRSLYATNFGTDNFLVVIEYYKKQYEFDTTANYRLFQIAIYYMFLGEYEKSLAYFLRFIEKDKITAFWTERNGRHRIGAAFWQNGFKEEAQQYFDQQLDYCYRSIELGRAYANQELYAYYDLAATYAFMGEKEEAFENLRIFNQKEIYCLWMVTWIKNDPLFDNIRDEPEFQQIVRDVESKHQAEHERVRKWLEENDML